MDWTIAKAKLLENEEVKKEYEKLQDIKCSRCKNYRKIYIHPWSEGIPSNLKWSDNGFACLLPNDEEFMKSFNRESYTPEDLRIEVMVGKKDSVGCEDFEEKT